MNTFNEFGQPVGKALSTGFRPHCPGWSLQVAIVGLMLRMEHAHALFFAYSVGRRYPKPDVAAAEPDATAEEFAEWVASVSELADPIHFTVIDNQTQFRRDAVPDADRSQKRRRGSGDMFTSRHC